MSPAEGISKLGFRRWYERQLIESHVYFVTCFLSMILVAACLEQANWRVANLDLAMMAIYIGGGAALCFFALRRYNYLLARAESLAEQSTCVQCRTYGILQVIEARHPGSEGAEDPPADWLRVRCKKCAHEWRMTG
jgi:hypothetical protein